VLSYNLPDAEVDFGNKEKAGFLFTDPKEPFVQTSSPGSKGKRRNVPRQLKVQAQQTHATSHP